MKSKFVAISAISASFVAILLIIGAYIELFDIFAVVFSSAFVILPLYFNSYKGSFLCYLAGGFVALICGIGNITSIVFPSYFCFFGIFPIVKFIAQRSKKYKLFYLLFLIWCVATMYGLFFYYTEFLGLELSDMPKFISDNVLYFIALFGVVFFVIYNRFISVIRRIEDFYLPRIVKK